HTHSHAATTAAAAHTTTARRSKRGEVWETAVLLSLSSVIAVALVRMRFCLSRILRRFRGMFMSGGLLLLMPFEWFQHFFEPSRLPRPPQKWQHHWHLQKRMVMWDR
ncbi:hypothetical protein TcCL_NonESM09140, partial [Trypanosoma cruzi]